jgi:hypothetical protein
MEDDSFERFLKDWVASLPPTPPPSKQLSKGSRNSFKPAQSADPTPAATVKPYRYTLFEEIETSSRVPTPAPEPAPPALVREGHIPVLM